MRKGLIAPPSYARGLFSANGDGFFFPAEPDAKLTDPKYHHDANPYIQISSLLESAKRGDFADCHLVSELPLRHAEDPTVWYTWATFLGYVCPMDVVNSAVQRILSTYRGELPYYVCDHVSRVMASTQQLVFVPTLMDWWSTRADTELGELLAGRLGVMLEHDWGAISMAAGGERAQRDRVEAACATLRNQAGTESISVRRGELFSARGTALRMLSVLRDVDADREDFIDDRLVWEACTGVDLRPAFRNGELLTLTAAAIVEDALNPGTLDVFDAGSRYFFGHRIR